MPGYIVGDLRQASKSITDLLARAEAAEGRCEALEKVVKEYQDTIVPGYREQAEKAEKERDAAIKELDGVASAVDDLAEFIDEQVHPIVPYDIYTALRENADAVAVWQYESEWSSKREG